MEVPLLFWAAISIATLVYAVPSRLRRDHFHEESRPTRLSNCQLNCKASFERDFHAIFQKSYETDYFDFPIDPLISSNTANFKSFCRLVNESQTCYKNECNLKTEETQSPHSYICTEKRADFEEAMDCLNKTSRQINCHTGCSRMARRSINSTQEDYETRGMIEVDKQSFHEQNLRCRFQACAMECRNHLIDNFCPSNQRPQTLRTVREYYISDLSSDWNAFKKDEKSHLFSRFCRRMLNNQEDDDDSSSYYNPSYENTMDKIREYVRSAIDNC
ncbi:hypothetical protein M3Y97_00225700 [Aphelenchoides bicaudatus]|nr:hypothetical protein M3Y97_00225700 [Aphelenchoides bicaudatus]